MDTRIKVTDYEITPDVSNYLDERLKAIEKILQADDGARVEVELGKSAGHSRHGAGQWFIELNVITKGDRFRTKVHAETLNESIDEAKDEMVRILRRERQLHRRMWKKGASSVKKFLRFEK